MKDSIDMANEQYQQDHEEAPAIAQDVLDEQIRGRVLDELRSVPESFIEAITEQSHGELVDLRSAIICAIDSTPSQEISDRMIGERMRKLVFDHIAANVREQL